MWVVIFPFGRFFALFIFCLSLLSGVTICFPSSSEVCFHFFSGNHVLFYTHLHPNTYTRNVKGVFEIKPCISSGLKYLLTWRHVLKSFSLLATIITLLILLHLKIWGSDFSKGCWFWFPFSAESNAQFEVLERCKIFSLCRTSGF